MTAHTHWQCSTIPFDLYSVAQKNDGARITVLKTSYEICIVYFTIPFYLCTVNTTRT